ncbi:OLC1v1024105C1 [Oldenlandia corymbosa var. corymbosa]|uniref:OLC1v1024105C1 n=1 Tax=Oldenlandia corymbosa var. corymbosa TaxID=529605 RepID=A0AAV1C4K3_OLDCO|nr:OLC1v1024105C1 [Oldenlandia corymbosa var. corymbosa]
MASQNNANFNNHPNPNINNQNGVGTGLIHSNGFHNVIITPDSPLPEENEFNHLGAVERPRATGTITSAGGSSCWAVLEHPMEMAASFDRLVTPTLRSQQC